MRSTPKLFVFLVLFVLATACKDDDPAPASPESITIDGKVYEIVKIGNQTWTAANYAGAGGVAYDAVNSKPEYGKYYTYAEVKAITLPPGWRLPTKEDYIALAKFYDITVPSYGNTEAIGKLTSTTHWNHVHGSNASGFNAHPAGYRLGDSPAIDGDIAEFWTAEGVTLSIQEAGTNLSELRILLYESTTSDDYRFNVRFIKD